VAKGYIYYVSLKGVTGAANIDTRDVEAMIARIRAHARCRSAWASASATARPRARGARGRCRRDRQPHRAGARGPPRDRRARGAKSVRGVPQAMDAEKAPHELVPQAHAAQDQARGRAAEEGGPGGLWSKCPSCEAVLYFTDLENNLHVCPEVRLPQPPVGAPAPRPLPRCRGARELASEVVPLDPLKFKDSRKYSERLERPRRRPARPTRWW
jgi:hypothetical protein